MPTSNDNEDGIMDRLAKKLFASPSSPLTAFADRQRVERLDQCRQLERILEACQSAARNNNENDPRQQQRLVSTTVEELPNSRSGARISRFFGWNSSDGSDQQNVTSTTISGSVLDDATSSIFEDNGEKIMQIKGKKSVARMSFSDNCAIETHELWACRALAVGCGSHLAELRQCWSDAERQSLLAKMKEDGVELYSNSNSNKKDASCRSVQLNMARCVNKNSAELDERVKASEANNQ